MKKSKFSCFLILLFLLSSLLNAYPAQAASAKDYSLSATQATLLLDDSMTLSVEGVTDEEISFKADNSSIASIEVTDKDRCELTSQAVGKTTITVKIKKKESFFFMNSTTTLYCKLSVTPKAVSVKFKKKEYKLPVGTSKKTAVILRPSITTEIPVFSSSNPDIATVNTKGKVTAISKGTTIVSATIKNGMTVRCKIIVSENKAHNSKTNKTNKTNKTATSKR